MKSVYRVVMVFVLGGFLAFGNDANAQKQNPKRTAKSVRVTKTKPVKDAKPKKFRARAPYAIPNKFMKFGGKEPAPDKDNFVDPAQQSATGTSLAAALQTSFDGASDDDNAAVIGGRVVPPDTDGDVGPNHYVQMINNITTIFDKNGNVQMGPVPNNIFWTGADGECESTNDGDPIVLYDELADRWLVSQFAVGGGVGNYAQCIAISTGPDPTGSYHAYEFDFGTDFPDYPKIGVWNDAYYMTTRNFANGGSFTGVQAVAFDRDAMLAGAENVDMVVFDVPGGTQNDGWLPADADGAAAPSGTAGIFAGGPRTVGTNRVVLYELDVDWNNPSGATLSQIADLGVDAYDTSISSVRQPSPGESLDALAAFLMFRMQYRNFGTHQTLLLNHTVDVGRNRAGIRWYELRNTGGGWSVYQQGTYAPNDKNHRWVGSIAMNGDGDIALGFTITGRNTFPSVRFTGQTADQSGSGVMNVAETSIVDGGGVQTSNSYNRWGDYSATAVDPSDDLTFWHTNEYYANSGSFDFKTRIGAFTIGDGGGPGGDPTDLHIETIATGTVNQGRGNKSGQAVVTIQDDLGSPVSGVTLSGVFSGTFNESAGPEVTNGSGQATFETGATAKGGVSVNFCVDSVSGGGLPYDANDNGSGAYDCGTNGPSASVSEVSVDDLVSAVFEFGLDQNYPNPFRSATSIRMGLDEGSYVSLRVFNMLGQEVAVVADGQMEAGRHEFVFDASGLSAGMYIYRLDANGKTETMRMSVLR